MSPLHSTEARPWALVGPPGAGKTHVGRALAQRLGWAAWDLDDAIEADAGCSIGALFANAGEAGFRRQEARTLSGCLAQPGPFVLACGGGTWMQPALQAELRRRCQVVCLTASPKVLLARILADRHGKPRPLLAGPNPEAALRALLRRRAATYARCPAQVDTTHLDVAGAVAAVLHAGGVGAAWGSP